MTIIYYSSFINGRLRGGGYIAAINLGKVLSNLGGRFIEVHRFSEILRYGVGGKRRENILIIDGIYCMPLLLLPLLMIALRPKRVIVFSRGAIFPSGTNMPVSHSAIKSVYRRILVSYREYYMNLTLVCSSFLEMERLKRSNIARERDKVIYDPLDIEGMLRTVSLGKKNSARDLSFNRMRKLNVVFFSGQRAKNAVFVFELIDLLLKEEELKKFNIIIVGPMNKGKQFMSQPEITYTGQITREKSIKIISTCDVLLLPSLYESYAYVVVEAILARTYCITSTGTPWKWLNRTDLGVCIELVVKAWVDTLLKFYEHPSSFLCYSQSKKYLMERHCYSSAKEKIIEIINN